MNLALFDLDHTLLSGDSDYQWPHYLITRGVLDGALYERKNAEFFAQYQAGTLDIEAFIDFQFKVLADHPRSMLEEWRADYLATRILPLISDKARALVAKHQAQGDLCALVTATNSFITAPIAREFGIAHLIATIAAQENGRFTGKARGTPAFREGKIVRVEAWLESFALYWGSFSETWFYSDSFNDLPLMKIVSHPVAVNPDATLLAHAEAAGWQILNLHT